MKPREGIKERVSPMHNAVKIVVALLVVALIAVIGLIYLTMDPGAGEPTAAVTAQPTADVAPTATEETGTTGDENTENTPQPDVTEDPAQTDEAAKEAQNNAQGTMYEGALAGLSEEEIAALAMAEEEAGHNQGLENDGAEGAVD